MTVNIFIRCAVQRNRINQSNWIIIVNGYTISRCTIFRTAMRKELKCCPSSLHILALSLLFSLALIYRSCYAHIWFFPTSVFPFIVVYLIPVNSLFSFFHFYFIFTPFSAFFQIFLVSILFFCDFISILVIISIINITNSDDLWHLRWHAVFSYGWLLSICYECCMEIYHIHWQI